MIQELADLGCSASIQDAVSSTPMHVAAGEGHVDAVLALHRLVSSKACFSAEGLAEPSASCPSIHSAPKEAQAPTIWYPEILIASVADPAVVRVGSYAWYICPWAPPGCRES